MRGRVQVEWRCSNQTRANGQRTWLNGQLTGRGFIAEDIPKAALRPQRGVWLTTCDVGFDTAQDGETVQTLALARLSADSQILAGSWVQYHECLHDDGVGDCSATVTRTVK